MRKLVKIKGKIKDNFVIEIPENENESDQHDRAFRVMKARMKSIGIPKYIWDSYKVESIETVEDKFDYE